ncbi:MAG: branched-chain amino acid aminotransferase [Ignavibacteriae bacterium]|nr:branched-chain amino acid aminotransferase [Ignavibacteriota bacterium]
MDHIELTRSTASRRDAVDWNNLGFGVYFSDHMFVADYKDGEWGDFRIVPYGPMEIEPTMCTLHYGQSIFEGLKAFRSKQGGANIFRPHKNAARLNHSAEKVCIPAFDENFLVHAIEELVRVDQDWIPEKRGHSLYIRPVVFGSDNFLGVQASKGYRLIVVTSPVASYYAEGLNPVRILVDDEHVRAVRGGLGTAKTAANYAASLHAGKTAKEKGFAQVLFLDGVSREIVEEVGAMNIMFVVDDELITPALSQGSILAGVTRDSVLTLARARGMRVTERPITVEELVSAHADGRLKEVFGTGTAAVISPVGELVYRGSSMVINGRNIGPIAQYFYDTITGIQYGEIEDALGWNVTVQLEHAMA